MGLAHVYQVIIICIGLLIPVTAVLLLMKLKIIPPSYATIGGFLAIFAANQLEKILTLKYGFTEAARVQGSYIAITVGVVSIYIMYKNIKEKEKENRDKTKN